MLTTSRKEAFANDEEVVESLNTKSTVDTKIMGRESYVADSEAKKASSVRFQDSYFADDSLDDVDVSEDELMAKLLGDSKVEWDDLDESDTENYTNPDLMPTSETMGNTDKETVKTKKSRNKVQNDIVVEGVNKVAVVGYFAVVLAIIIAICFVAVAVNASLTNIAGLQMKITQTTQDIEEMYVEVQENVDAYAAELGLVNTADAKTVYYEAVDTRDKVTYNIPSNWFDNVCDWFSSIFGG